MTVITIKPVYDKIPRQEVEIPLMVTGGSVCLGDLSLMGDFAEDALLRFRFDTVALSEARQGDTKRGRKPSKRRKG